MTLPTHIHAVLAVGHSERIVQVDLDTTDYDDACLRLHRIFGEDIQIISLSEAIDEYVDPFEIMGLVIKNGCDVRVLTKRHCLLINELFENLSKESPKEEVSA